MKKILFPLLILSIILTNCKDDEEDMDACSQGTMSLTFDGVTSTQTAFNNTLLKEVQQGQSARRLDIRTNVNGGTLVISVSNWDWQNPPANGVLQKNYSTLDYSATGSECRTISGIDYCDGALVTFVQGFTSSFSVGEGYNGFINITNINASNLTISGTFDAELEDFSSGDTFIVSGSFSNLCYRVM